MKRGEVVLVRFPHPSGLRGKKRPAVVLQEDRYSEVLRTVVVAEVTKNLAMKDDPACLFIEIGSPKGKSPGLLVDSVVSSLILNTVYADSIAQVLGRLSPAMMQQLDLCLKVGLGLS